MLLGLFALSLFHTSPSPILQVSDKIASSNNMSRKNLTLCAILLSPLSFLTLDCEFCDKPDLKALCTEIIMSQKSK